MNITYLVKTCSISILIRPFKLAVVFHALVKKKIYSTHLIILLTFLYAAPAFASCSPSMNIKTSIPNIALNLNSIPVNGQIGSEFTSDTNIAVSCNASDAVRRFNLWTAPNTAVTSVNGINIYKTNNPGIGFAFGFEPTNFCTSVGTVWMTGSFSNLAKPVCDDSLYLNKDYNYMGRFHYILYKISPTITNGPTSLPRPNYGLFTEYTNATNGQGGYFMSSPSSPSFSVTASTCKLLSSSIRDIKLPTISITSLPSRGSRAGNTNFNIIVNCPSLTNLNITFTDNNNRNNTGTMLTPTLSSIAQGVRIQLQYNGNIIKFGPDSAEPGTTGQIVLNSNLAGTQTFPFTASYIRTGASLKPGSLTSAATFTLSYQ
ncbi:fimbrial protein precursor [Aquitalea magnusonii]|uniref:Fimbrial protein n=1 Tax=Aquitalea magnusonii TaxID=332411 RepID=A0A3G9GNU9_9NEIS|nr:fimbrial protein [Aquitalea magnusonii]BBF87471.1 fimbrial protein precursor [Aquitalea magnusonii]